MLLACTLGFLSLSACAQDEELKPFKVDVSLGYAVPSGKGAKGGVLFAVEPKYAVIPNLAVGLRLELAAMARITGRDASGGVEEAEVKAASSYLITGDYYFTNNYSFRPFVGAGAGLYGVAGGSANVNNPDAGEVGASSRFGGMLRGGAELRHFRFGVEYNMVGDSKYTVVNSGGITSEQVTAKNSYLGIKLGVCIGGGPR